MPAESLQEDPPHRFRALFDSCPVGVWLEDFTGVARWFDRLRADGVTDLRKWLEANPGEVQNVFRLVRVIDVNREAVRQNGASSKEHLISNLANLFGPGTHPVLAEELAQLWEGRSTIDLETITSRLDGGHMHMVMRIHVPGAPREPDWSGVIVTGTDITARKEMEERLRIAAIEAAASNRAKGRFLADMSHEIRTPMNGMIGLVELLLLGPLDPAQREMAETLRSSSLGLLALLNDILDLSKLEAGKMPLSSEAFDPRNLLRDCLDLQAPEAHRKGLSISASVARDVPQTLVGDALRIRQILLNLLGNAVKFTRVGSVVARVSRDRERLEFCVEDSGIGISPEALCRLFEPFQQAGGSTAREFGGTGLGLAISRELSARMGGSISAESEPGRGSLFRFSLPLQIPAGSPDPGPEAEPEFEGVFASAPESAGEGARQDDSRESGLPEARTSRLSVLVAEDNTLNQRVLVKSLQRAGIEPVVTSNGLEAVRAAAKTDFDLVILDIQMPEMDGLQAAGRILDSASRRPYLVALSANAFEEDKRKALDAGFDAYLSKPFRQNELLDLIGNLGRPSI